MAMELLKGVKNVGGYSLVDMEELKNEHPEKFNESGGMDWKWFEKEVRPSNYVYARHDKNSLSFTFTDGNTRGCKVSTLVEAAMAMVNSMNERKPSEDFERAMGGLRVAIKALAIVDV